MEHRAGPLLANRSLSALIVATFVLSAFAGLFVMSNPAPIAAQTPIGDLIVTDGTYTVENVNQPVDGDILVSGGELIVRNAALLVISDVSVQRTVTVETGGTMTLEHGILTTYLDQIEPWPFLEVNINGGTLIASEKSLFSFPGTITVQNGGELILYDSTIESLSPEDISQYISGSPSVATDAADDGPAISVIDGSIMMFDSEITNLPEYPSLGLVASNLTLSGESTLLAVNSYISIDFGPALSASDWYVHNMLVLSDESHAYLYGCTFYEYSGAYASRASAIESDGENTSPAIPFEAGVADNTGQSIASLATSDGSTYEVGSQETLAIDTWNTTTIDDLLEVSSITLVASYSISPTYAGTNAIQWAPDGGSYASTDIIPSASNPDGTWYYELPITSLPTVGDVLDADIRFINNGAIGTGPVEFDRLWLMFTIGGDAYIYRWLNVTVGDEYGVPIPDATISAKFTGATELEGEEALYYTANGVSETPPVEVLNYMGETSESYLMTKSDGEATIPYLTDMITSNGSKNSIFVGSYAVTGSIVIGTVTHNSTETFSFPAYPAMTSSDQQFDITVDVQGISAESPDPSRWLVVPPDLTIEDMSYYHAGDVIVASTGTLILRNAVFELVQSTANERSVYVDGSLVIENSNVHSALPIDIIVKGDGTLEVNGSTLNGVNIVAMDDALVILRDSSFDGTITTSWDSSARIVVVDSMLAQAPVLSGNALGEFTNSSVPSIVVTEDAKALIYRWIHVTVLDGGDNTLSGATVSAWFFANNTFWSSEVSNESGIAQIKSLGTILTSEGSTFIGNYKINSTYLSDGVMHYSQTISIGVKPYTEPLTENATFAVLRMSTVILPDLSVKPGYIWTTPSYVVIDSPCTIFAQIENTGDEDANDVLVEFLIGAVGSELATATLLNSTEISTIPYDSQVTVDVGWIPDSVGTFTIWVVINGGLDGTPDFDELTFADNQESVDIRVLDHADLSLGAIQFLAGETPVPVSEVPGDQVVYVRAVLYNEGEAPVSNPTISLTVNYSGAEDELISQTLYGITLYEGFQYTVEFAYLTPLVVNDTEFTFIMEADPYGVVTEPDLSNNIETAMITVLDIREDFKVDADDISVNDGSNVHEFGRSILITANVHNLGGTDPGNVSVRFSIVQGDLEYVIGIKETNIPQSLTTPIEMVYTIHLIIGGTYSIVVSVDYDDNYSFEKDETNNEASVDFEIVDLVYHITMITNSDTGEFEAGQNAFVTLNVYYGATAPDVGAEVPVPLLPGVSVNLVGPGTNGPPVASADPLSTSIFGEASFTIALLPGLETGQYTLIPVVQEDEQPSFSLTIHIDGEVSGRGIALWVWIAIIGVIVGSLLGVTAYIYFRGLGKLVECGECGAFIPAANKRCPKCGVEFEVGTMKCSECGAWVPAESTECPNCGVKFVGEEIGEEDYLEKMRGEYDEMVSKYRELAKPELGKKFSDKKFDEWWATQPTYISFEDWLAKEEEKRKEGPVPCPVCGTMNPKESSVCHKCGTVFGVEKEVPPGEQPPTPPSSGEPSPESSGVEPAPPSERTVAQQPSPPQAAAPKMVIRRPIDRKVVPKKIIKTPIAKTSDKDSNGSDDGEDQQ